MNLGRLRQEMTADDHAYLHQLEYKIREVEGLASILRYTARSNLIPKKQPQGSTLSDLIVLILSGADENGLRLGEITDCVKEAGYRSESKRDEEGLRQVVYQSLLQLRSSSKVILKDRHYRVLNGEGNGTD